MTAMSLRVAKLRQNGVADTIRAAGGAVYGITSEPQALVSEAENEWRLPLSVTGDPQNEIRNLGAQNKWLEIFLIQMTATLEPAHGFPI